MIFKEHKEFHKLRPWGAIQYTFEEPFTTPPHYADTIEILIFHNVKGDAHFGGRHFKLEGDRVYFVAPDVVHAFYYEENDGILSTLKINPALFKPLLDIEALLAYHNLSYSDLPLSIPLSDEVYEIADIFLNSKDVKEVMIATIRFFQLLINHLGSSDLTIASLSSVNDDFLKIISWTEENFKRKITVEDAAQVVGYSRHYFCRKFKMATGVTYMRYLNSTRIFHACNLLKQGDSVTKVCRECGFDDLPYFTQLFKKIAGKTPTKYVADCKNDKRNVNFNQNC